MKSSAARVSGEEGGRRGRRVASYLAQLRQLVPLVPLDRPVSQLEVIQHVIDYISQLEQQLERRGPPLSAQQAAKRRLPLQEVTRNAAAADRGDSQTLKQAHPGSLV